MPIYFPTAPEGGAEIISANLDAPPRGRRPSVAAESESATQLAGQHQIYVVPAEAVLGGELLAAAQPVGWRYLVINAGDALAAAELSADAEGKLAFAQRNVGPFVEATVDAIRTAEQLEPAQRADYEVRLLRVPAAYLVAVWLHGASDDLLLPLKPVPAGVDAARVYTPDELLPKLVPVIGRNAVLGNDKKADQ